MTGYTVHTGSTVKFSIGWDQIFGSTAKDAKPGTKGKPAAKPAASKRAKSRASRKTR